MKQNEEIKTTTITKKKEEKRGEKMDKKYDRKP